MPAYFNNSRPLNLSAPTFKGSVLKKGMPEKEPYAGIKKVSDKKKQEVKESAAEKAEMDLFFLKAQKACTGKCANCGGYTAKARANVAHILPKSVFKSVATHDLVWIELCVFGNDCHDMYDKQGAEKRVSMKIWPEVVKRFKVLYPLIKEKGQLPDEFINEIEI